MPSSSEYHAIKSRNFKESSPLIFQKVFRKISKPCWKVFYHVRTDDKKLYWQLDSALFSLIELIWMMLFYFFYFWCLTPLSAIIQLYHDDQFQWRKKPEYPETMGKQSVNFITCGWESSAPFFCNLQSRSRTHAVLVINLYELLGNPTTQLIEPPGPSNWYYT